MLLKGNVGEALSEERSILHLLLFLVRSRKNKRGNAIGRFAAVQAFLFSVGISKLKAPFCVPSLPWSNETPCCILTLRASAWLLLHGSPTDTAAVWGN